MTMYRRPMMLTRIMNRGVGGLGTAGGAEWVRNVRAAGGEAVIRHRGRRSVRLEEVAAEQRAPILRKYLGENAMSTKRHFGVDPKADVAEFAAVAGRHPAFRVIEGG